MKTTKVIWRTVVAVALLLTVTGCLKVKDALTLHEDGSGTVAIEVEAAMPAEMMGGDIRNELGLGGGGSPLYPPMNKAMADAMFPAKDFSVTVNEPPPMGGATRTTTVTAQFKDVNALLASPYGRAHSLVLKREGETLKFRALSGAQALAMVADNKDYMQQMGAGMNWSQGGLKPEELYVEFRVTLPGTINAGNGQTNGATAIWIVDRSKIKDGPEAIQRLGTVMEASCAASGLKFAPTSPVRLNLDKFQDLVEGSVGGMTNALDAKKVLAAARFAPQTLQTSRSIDLSGEGNGQNNAQLAGLVVVPPELAPSKIGEFRLEEVTDATGKDLKPSDSGENNRGSRYISRFVDTADGGDVDEDENDERNKVSTEDRYNISLSFNAPDWKASEITRIRGSIELQYFGASDLIKIENAISKVATLESMMHGGFESGRQKLSHPKFNELGLSIAPQQCVYQQGMTMIMLQVQGKKATVKEVQVFDADGQPWPAFSGDMGMGMGEESSWTIMIPGKPKPPLSLALIVSGNATTIALPVLMEHIPLVNPAK